MKKLKSSKQVFIPAAILTILLCCFVLVSCSFFSESENAQEQAVSTEAEASPQEEQPADVLLIEEVTIWDKLEPGEQIQLMDTIEKYTALNQQIKINTRHFRSEEELVDQFRAASLAGAGPEIVLARLESASVLAGASVLKPITDDMAYPDILEGLAEISAVENKSYAIPFRAFDFLMLFYNRDFISEAPESFEELIEYCREVNNPKEETYGFILNSSEADWILPFIGGYQDWVYDYSTGAINLDTQATVKTLEFLTMLYNQEKVVPQGYEYEDINNAFKEGRAHMIINGNWAVEEYIENGPDFGIAEIPVVWGGLKNPTPMIDGIGFMINANTFGKSLENTKSFIEYLMSEEIQQKWTENTATMPSLKSMASSPFISSNQYYLAQARQSAICRGKPPGEALIAIREALMMNLKNVLSGSIIPEDAVKKIQEDVIKLRSGSETGTDAFTGGPDENADTSLTSESLAE